jgi:hypothetical protein
MAVEMRRVASRWRMVVPGLRLESPNRTRSIALFKHLYH